MGDVSRLRQHQEWQTLRKDDQGGRRRTARLSSRVVKGVASPASLTTYTRDLQTRQFSQVMLSLWRVNNVIRLGSKRGKRGKYARRSQW